MSARISALTKRVTALAGAVALATATLLGGAVAASAAPAGPGNVDFDAVGSIIIHKYQQPATANEPSDGGELTPEELSALGVTTPLEGVGFTVTPVNLDLTVDTNWDNLEQLTYSNGVVTMGDQTLTLGAASAEQTTAADGSTTFAGLPVGVYLVQETSPGDNNITRPVEPYFVVLPTPVDNVWNYDIHSYPKNSLSEATKTPRPGDVTENGEIDQQVIWDVTANAPVLLAGDTFTKWELKDTLDPRLVFLSVENVQYKGEALVEGTDYTVAQNDQEITVALTPSRLAAILADGGNGELTFEIHTDATAVEDGVIPNAITSITNVNGHEVEVDSTETTTYVGEIDILKRDAANKQALAGAEFQVFASLADAQARVNPITVGGETTFTTDAQGHLNVSPLNVPNETDTRTYWVVETKAPEGFVLPQGDAAITEVAVKAGTTTPVLADTVEDTVAGAELIVNNEKQDGPDLPLTGGLGTWMFIGGGAALVLIAVGVAMRARRAEHA